MPKKTSAFTLVELLVAIGIIGLLTALLLPVLARAQEMARTSTCQSRLHELLVGWQMYAGVFEGMAVPARDYTDAKYYKFWSGRQDKTIAASNDSGYDATQGFLWPFMGHRGLSICPSWPRAKVNNGQLGYGYNWMYFSYYDGNPDGSGKRIFYWTQISQIKNPGSKVVFADCARPKKADPTQLETTPFLGAPSQQYPSFHARHLRKGNVAWADGHVTGGVAPVLLRDPYVYSGATFTVSALKRNDVGDLDRDGDPKTDELFTVE